MKFKGMKQAGFSLVELMVVVGIIGILAAIAVPKLQQFTAKSKQSEARISLKSIDTMQQAFYAENSFYGILSGTAANTIGWAPAAGAKYTYTGPTATNASAYTATATIAKLCPADNDVDTWTVDQTSAIANPTNGANGC